MKRAERQPLGAIHLYGGVFVREMLTPDAGTMIPQHSHTYPHLSYVAAGAVRCWREDVLLGDFEAPCAIRIEAMARHSFLTLAPGTLVLCLHAVTDGEDADVHEEHHLELED